MPGNWTSATVPPIALNRDLQMVKAGANYRFESGTSEAVERTGAAGSARPADEDLAKQSQNPNGARMVPDKFASYHRELAGSPGQQWTVPIGGDFGRLFKLGDQPVSAQIQGFYNVIRPTGSPSWQLRVELSLLSPDR